MREIIDALSFTNMQSKYSLAAIRRWKKIPKKERSKQMRVLAKQKASKMTPEERKELSKRMNQAKRNKKVVI